MGLESDITVNVPKFQKESVSEATEKFNETLMDIMSNGPKWYEVRKPRGNRIPYLEMY